MGYTGDVEVGGPADVRELPGLTISKLAVSEMANNAYLLHDPDTGEALLIDAAAEPEALRTLIGDADVRTVVTTHGHWDHHGALPQVIEATGAQTVAHPADAADLPLPVTRPVEHGDTVPVGDHALGFMLAAAVGEKDEGHATSKTRTDRAKAKTAGSGVVPAGGSRPTGRL